MKPGLTKTVRFVLFLMIGVFLIWVAFRGISFSDLGSILLKANYLWLLLSIMISIGGFAIRARRWMLLMEPLGQIPSFKNTYHSVLTGYLGNMLFPRLGEVSRCAALSKKENMAFDKLIGTVILERTIDMVSVLIILGFMLIYGSASSGAFLTDNIFKPMNEKLMTWFGFSGAIYVLAITIFIISLYLLFRYRKKLSGHPLMNKVLSFMSGILDGLKTIAGLRRKWEFIILTVLLWVSYLLMAWIPVFCLEATSGLDLGAGIFILVIGSLGMAVPVQSGIGAFHWIVSRGINFVYGIPLDQGLAYATLEHESQMILIAILGSVSLFVLFGRKGSRILTETSPSHDSKE